MGLSQVGLSAYDYCCESLSASLMNRPVHFLSLVCGQMGEIAFSFDRPCEAPCIRFHGLHASKAGSPFLGGFQVLFVFLFSIINLITTALWVIDNFILCLKENHVQKSCHLHHFDSLQENACM